MFTFYHHSIKIIIIFLCNIIDNKLNHDKLQPGLEKTADFLFSSKYTVMHMYGGMDKGDAICTPPLKMAGA